MKQYFFKNDSDDYRIVLQANSDSFMVIKLIKDGPSTLKIWKGTSLAETSKYWSTKPFEPTPEEEFELAARFNRALASFKAPLYTVLGWSVSAMKAEAMLAEIQARKDKG